MSFIPQPCTGGGGEVFIEGGDGSLVTGTGTSGDPFIIDPVIDPDPSNELTVGPSGLLVTGSGGLDEIWLSGANFAGNAAGFGSPGGAGNLVSYNYTGGVNRFGIAELAIPSSWTTFNVIYFVSSPDANNTHNFIFESSYQLVTDGTVFNAAAVAHPQSSLNTGGAEALTSFTAIPNITRGTAKILNYLVRSNNATQEIAGEIRLLGLLFTKVT